MRRLEGLRAIVTGAEIGRAIAIRLSGEGARVVLSDVDEEAMESVSSELDGESLVRRTDAGESKLWWSKPSRKGAHRRSDLDTLCRIGRDGGLR
jgi:NAD(P)-dependent dehydrogenase (short-subunit alcohol dehydrogenase family)